MECFNKDCEHVNTLLNQCSNQYAIAWNNCTGREREAIKTCPCCGSEAKYDLKHISGHGYDDGYYVHVISCIKCSINTGQLGSKETCIRVWNMRV